MRDLAHVTSHGKTASTFAQAWHGIVRHFHFSVCCMAVCYTLNDVEMHFMMMQRRLGVITAAHAPPVAASQELEPLISAEQHIHH